MSQKNREPGFYWVKFVGCDWQVHYFSGQMWLCGKSHFYDSDLSEIDERRITREEPTK